MRPSPALLCLALAVPALIGGCGGDDEGATTGLPEGCEEVDAPDAKELSLDRPPARPPAASAAVVETSCGDFTIELEKAGSPKTVASFGYMVEEGLYDGTTFHRIEPGFVIQGGDPSGDGTGGPGYFVDERPAPDTFYPRGSVAMAKSAAEPPGRSGSQFFVVTAPADAGLTPEYALLGEVTEGLDVVERIESVGQVEGEPKAPVVIERIVLR